MRDTSENDQGLSTAQARELLLIHGPNALPQQETQGIARIVGSVLQEPMFVLLLVAAAAYLLVGSHGEGVLMCGAAALTVGLVVVQESRSDRALAALRDLSSPQARVIRDGREQRVPARDLVPGDLVVIGEGDRVPADILLQSAEHVLADESILTGESVPVRKLAAGAGVSADADIRPGGEDLPLAFSGTLIVRGRGLGRVARTGVKTALGAIGVSLATIATERTRMQRNVEALVQVFGILAIVVCASVVLLIGLLKGDWFGGILAGITLAISMVPEEFPMVLSIFLAIGAFRMTRHNVLARKAAVIETLGAATVLCTDKTGTLTENRMRVRGLYRAGEHLGVDAETQDLPKGFMELLDYALLATRPQSFDPMEQAVDDLGRRVLGAGSPLRRQWQLGRVYDITPELLAMSQAWRAEDGRYIVATKGAPEAIAQLCALPPEPASVLLGAVEAMAAKGLRVIAVGAGRCDAPGLPPRQTDFAFKLMGLVGFADPLRESAQRAVAEALGAGMKVAMITGDYPATALAIAREAGLDVSGGVLSGAEIQSLSEADLRKRLERTRVFARVMPEQKLRLVEAFKANGEVVAMTGDGVNDAPALKAAHIGIAMGGRGTDVAREAAGIVLTDDHFGSIVKAVAMGRRIFDNLRKALVFVTSIHMPIAGLALRPLIFGMPPILFPVQVVFLELIIDPTASIAFEADQPEGDIMRRRPRAASEPMFSTPQLIIGLIQGVGPLIAALAANVLALKSGSSPEIARALAFVTVVFGILGLVRINANQHCFRGGLFGGLGLPFAAISGLAAFSLAVAVGVPQARVLFHFELPDGLALMLAAAAGVGSVLWFEIAKLSPTVRRIMGSSG